MTYRGPRAAYAITVENPDGVNRGVVRLELDGVAIDGPDGPVIPAMDDGRTHHVRVVLGGS
jgi:hypothetical protein